MLDSSITGGFMKGSMIKGILTGIILWAVFAASFGQKGFDDKTYRLKPEDVIRIQVFNQQQIAAEVPVGIDGYIGAPFIGNLKVEGKTLQEVEAELYTLYVKKLKLRDPVISVYVIQYRRLKANITGMVQRSTELIFRPGDTIMTLYSASGGEIPDQTDLRKATLRRAGSRELIPIDMYAMLHGDNSQNYELLDGDILDIPREQRNRILVMGAVRSPGMYPYREAMKLSDAFAVASGEIPYRSRTSKTFVLRELPGRPGEYMKINTDYVRFMKSNDFAQNIRLMPGDLIYVPETNNPDFNQLQSIVNSAFVLNSLTRFFGF